MSNFIVQFLLKTERFQEDILNKRFEIGRKIYNCLVRTTQNRYKEMIKTKKYNELLSKLSEDKKNSKIIFKQIQDIRKNFSLTEYSFHCDVKDIQKYFKDNIDSFTAQKIATTLWKAYDKLFYGNGNRIYYKKYSALNSLEGKSNKSGIRFKEDVILWNGLKIPVKINYNNEYEYQALKSDISYCRIIRKYIRNRYKYYVQIVFKGVPPKKINRVYGEGDVGLDIGTQTIAVCSNKDVKIFELADRVQNIENEKQDLLIKMDMSRHCANPDNYDIDGTIKKQGNKKIFWHKSKRYIRLQNRLKELYRKQADVRKYQHECLSNYIVSLGNKIYVENMNFKGLQKRSTKTEKNDKGKFKKKKRFGKSLANKAPAMLLMIINRKLSYSNNSLIKIDTYTAKASQFNHMEQTYKKKKLSQRWNNFNEIKVQRDLYSAFLIMNISKDLKNFDIDKCNEKFDTFLKLHNLEVERLKGQKNLSSIAI